MAEPVILDVRTREIKTISEKINWLKTVYQAVTLMANYHDLMIQLSESEWAAYRVFATSNPQSGVGFGGLSPEGNFNIYATSDDLSESLIRSLLEQNAPKQIPSLIRGPIGNLAAIQAIDEIREVGIESLPYHHLEVPSERVRAMSFSTDSPYELRRATDSDSDMALIKTWYTTFNEESGTNWPTPNRQEVLSKRLFFLVERSTGVVLAAAANTLESRERFWVGRLMVFKPYRGAGVGRALWEKIFALAKTEGKSVAELVFMNNESALRLSDRLGFLSTGINAIIRIKKIE